MVAWWWRQEGGAWTPGSTIGTLACRPAAPQFLTGVQPGSKPTGESVHLLARQGEEGMAGRLWVLAEALIDRQECLSYFPGSSNRPPNTSTYPVLLFGSNPTPAMQAGTLSRNFCFDKFMKRPKRGFKSAALAAAALGLDSADFSAAFLLLRR